MSPQVKNRFILQDNQYRFPYHHLVRFDTFNTYSVLPWGFEYYAYIIKTLEKIKSTTPSSVLDVGCGDGKMLYELANSSDIKVLHGIDLSERAIYFAKAFNYGNRCVFEYKDIASIASSYDVITVIETMEHVPDADIKNVVSNISRCLNSGGWVIVSVPSVNFPVAKKHYRHYDEKLITDQFAGFELESIEYIVQQNFLYTILVKLFGKLSSFSKIRIFMFALAQKFLFKADKKTGRHIVCVFKKK